MPLLPGDRLGAYQIVAAVGAGGMGEVYRARDTRLNRTVAIKVLPPAFAGDVQRVARFTREAQVLAALNHPNIAALYGIEESALVMEFVDGEDLSALIARGPLPLDEVCAIARQIADALDAAHEQGIVHRDLKPANIKIRADGTVKVLDFGLARATDPGGTSAGGAMNSPTITARTQLGTIIGTAAYMSPEQARGKTVDRRADIWAFGAVVYEMLTGRRAFGGDDVSDILASVLKTEPDWAAMPAGLPPSMTRLVRRCLEKDPRSRLSSIGDARLELNEVENAPATPVVPPRPRPTIASRVWPMAVALVLAVAGMYALRPVAPPTAAVTRTSVLGPPGEVVYPDSAQVAISPDGTMVAFVTGEIRSTGLWIRSLSSLSAVRVEGTDGAILPFWSPDSKRIGFFTPGKLRTVSAAGGVAQTVCATAGNGARGGTWNDANVIVFAPDVTGALWKVAAGGGDPTPVTTLAAGTQSSQRFPFFLPDGEHFLYSALPARKGRFDIFVGSLGGGPSKLLAQLESAPVYVSPGYLLFLRQGVLVAQRFDSASLQLTGETLALADQPATILDPVQSYTAGRVVSASSHGVLAYVTTPSSTTVATWFDMTGQAAPAASLPDGEYSAVRISPDGTRAAVVRSVSAAEASVWLVDLARGGTVRLSSGPGRNESPVWSPDSTRIVFASDRDGPQDIYVKTLGDPEPEQLFYRSPMLFKNPEAWAPDGRRLIVMQLDADTAQNLYTLPVDEPRTLQPYISGPARDFFSAISPDGRFVSYTSTETGQFEIYVDTFPTAGHKRQVSIGGGLRSVWTPDGRHVLFLGGDRSSVWRADIDPDGAPASTAPVKLFSYPRSGVTADFSPDRKRLLALVPERAVAGSITLVHNWLSALGSGL